MRQSVVVRAPLRHTFETFVRTIGIWWPVQPFSAGQERVRDIALEQREGGRVYEIWDDGTEASWGELRSWSPPDGFVMTWQGTPVPTEVELSFTALGPELTRVTVEHRGRHLGKCPGIQSPPHDFAFGLAGGEHQNFAGFEQIA